MLFSTHQQGKRVIRDVHLDNLFLI